jgi:hypothetical protein
MGFIMRTEDFIGLSKTASQDLAERKNLIFRLISIDGRLFFSYPEDERGDRICIELENGRVAKAVFQ